MNRPSRAGNGARAPAASFLGARAVSSNHRVATFALVMAITGMASPSHGQDVEDYIDARIWNYRELGTAFKAINDELRKPKPSLPAIREASKIVGQAAKHQYNWFKPGSGAESGHKTKALPSIWSDPAKFKASQDRFAVQAGLFAAAAAGSDLKRVTSATKSLSEACNGCHKPFRKEE